VSKPVPVSIGKGSNKSRYGQEGLCEFTNAYIEERGESGKQPFVAYCINGLELFTTLTNGAGVRAALALDSLGLVVAGRILFSTDTTGSTVLTVGGIGSDGFVTMARNRKTPSPQVAIVCDGLWYIYEAGTLTQGTDPDLPPPCAVVEKDGYFVYLIPDGRWFIAGPNDGLNINAIDFAEAESSADGLVMGAVRGPDLVLAGQRSMEFWHDTGGTFPFSRVTSIDMGCYAAGTLQKIIAVKSDRLVDSIIWCATDYKGAFNGVHMLDGYTPFKISTREVDRLIRDEPTPGNLRAMAWTEDAHAFYAISGTNFTRVYDTAIGEWHKRVSFGDVRWRCGAQLTLNGMTLFGDYATNKLYRSKPTLMNENGERIYWSIEPPPIHMFPMGFLVPAIHVDALTGVGTTTATEQDADPELLIQYSRDGGLSYGPARSEKMGTTAQRFKSIKSRGLGRFGANGMSMRFSSTANVSRGIQGLSIVAKPLRA
jgi:hypothetical protein